MKTIGFVLALISIGSCAATPEACETSKLPPFPKSAAVVHRPIGAQRNQSVFLDKKNEIVFSPVIQITNELPKRADPMEDHSIAKATDESHSAEWVLNGLTLLIFLATIAVARYTSGLFKSTKGMATDANEYNRRTFLATHRPKLIVREAKSDPPNEGGDPLTVKITITNTGGSACTLVKSDHLFQVVRHPDFSLLGDLDPTKNLFGDLVFEAGESKELLITAIPLGNSSRSVWPNIKMLEAFVTSPTPANHGKVLFVGSMVYRDTSSPPIERRTKFYLQMNLPTSHYFIPAEGMQAVNYSD